MSTAASSILPASQSGAQRQVIPPAVARSIVTALAHRFVRDPFVIVEGDTSRRFGGASNAAGPTIRIHDARCWPMVLTGGSAGLGESYIRGWWSVDDLTAALRILARALLSTEWWRTGLHRMTAPFTDRMRRRRRRPDKTRDRNNIAAHYDLSNAFFELLLDPTMMYSSGWFDDPSMSLEHASIAKLDRLCRAVGLEPEMRVVEIGTGWGGFAIHAARTFGVHVTTTTISKEQFDFATARVRSEGLADRITVLDSDYRDLTGTYDRVISIEMIEAVDWREIDGYFEACASLLEPGGLMGLQSILIDDDRYERAKITDDFIKEFIFPGGCLPSSGSIERASRSAGLDVIRTERFGRSYAETLRRWRSNLEQHRDELAPLGLDDAFERMWNFYLCYCEAGFEERSIDVAQIVLERTGSSMGGR